MHSTAASARRRRVLPPSGRGERGIGRSAALGGKLRLSGRRKQPPLPLLPSIHSLRHAPAVNHSVSPASPAERPRTPCLPCARGGGFASAKPEGLLPIPRPGCTDIFAPAVNPSVTAKPRQLPLHRGATEQTPRQKIALSRRSGCTEETWAVQICTAEKLRQVKFLLPAFLFQKNHIRWSIPASPYCRESGTTKVSFACFSFPKAA